MTLDEVERYLINAHFPAMKEMVSQAQKR